MISILLVFLMLFGCASNSPGEREFNRIGGAVKKRLKNEYNLLALGIGASWPDKCKLLSFSFIDQSTANITKARELIVFATQVVIDVVNQNKEFQQYLAETPFTEDHVMLGITFEPPMNFISGLDKVSISSGIINYKVWNENATRYDSVLEETYEQALQILETQLE